jgi:hypothetical protein
MPFSLVPADPSETSRDTNYVLLLHNQLDQNDEPLIFSLAVYLVSLIRTIPRHPLPGNCLR